MAAGCVRWTGLLGLLQAGEERLQADAPSFFTVAARSSLAFAAGADVKVVQQMLGHKSAAMTLDVYARTCSRSVSTRSPTLSMRAVRPHSRPVLRSPRRGGDQIHGYRMRTARPVCTGRAVAEGPLSCHFW
jgi:hypothetical protein